MTTKTFSRTTIAVALLSCYFTDSAMAANPTPVALASATFTSKANELPVLRTYNVASNASGEFAVTLQAPITSGTQNQLLIFTENGTSIGTPISVPLTSVTSAPSGLAIDQDGDVAVAWDEITGSNFYPFFGYATITDTVYLQRFSSAGTALGAPTVVATHIASDSVSSVNGGPEMLSASSFSPPQVAMDDSGDVAVAWTEVTTKCSLLNFNYYGFCYGTSGNESSKTYAALYSSTGAVTVAPKVVDSLAFGLASETGYGHVNLLTGMRMSGAGNLVMLFDAARDTTSSLYAHLFGPGLISKSTTFKLAGMQPVYAEYLAGAVGHKINGEHALGTYSPPAPVFGGVNQPSYLAAFGIDGSGNFDVAWTYGSNYGVYVTRYDSSGNAIGSNIGPIAKLNTTTNGSCAPTVANAGGDFQLSVSPDGSFAVTWGEAMPYTGTGKTYSSCSMEKHAQFYKADGSANGATVLINQGATTAFNPDASLSAVDGNGNLVTIWNSIASPVAKSTDTLDAQLNIAP